MRRYAATENGKEQKSETAEDVIGKTSSGEQLGQAPSPLWELDITELAAHNIEAHGREEVNKMLKEGWRLLHIYTLHYQDDGVWRQRPMAIIGRSARGDA